MNTEKYSLWGFGMLAAVTLGVVAGNTPFITKFLSPISVYQPMSLYWIAIIPVFIFLVPRIHPPGRLSVSGHIAAYAAAGAMILLAMRFSVGFITDSIASSPYDTSPLGMVFNLLRICPYLIAKELARSHALTAAGRYSRVPIFWMVAITATYAAFEINFTKLMFVNSLEGWFTYVYREVLPFVAQSYLMSILVICGGPVAAVFYSGGLSIFQVVFPFLPSLPWIIESAFGIAFPIIFAMFVRDGYNQLIRRPGSGERSISAGYIITLASGVLFIWFVVGVFPVYPSVVLTGSMLPVIEPGDVVMIEKIANEEEIYNLEKDEIINFKREGITITHRITDVIIDEAGNVSFETKGDNNDRPDDFSVMPNDINGRIRLVVPKAGIPVLLLHSGNPLPEGVTDASLYD